MAFTALEDQTGTFFCISYYVSFPFVRRNCMRPARKRKKISAKSWKASKMKRKMRKLNLKIACFLALKKNRQTDIPTDRSFYQL